MVATREMTEYYVAPMDGEYHLVGLPTYGYDLKFLEDFASLGTLRIIGNSANNGRKFIGESLATSIGVSYVHAKLSSEIDELKKKQYFKLFRKGLHTFGACLAYQQLTVYSKRDRLIGLPDQVLDDLGLTKDANTIKRTILMFADSISILANGDIREKPESHEEGLSQISELVDQGMEYYLSNLQVAMWASGADGIGNSVDLLPLRVNRSLSRFQRATLKKNWIKLYESGEAALTPNCVSQAHRVIFPYMEVGLLPERTRHISSSIYVTDDVLNIEGIKDTIRWVSTQVLDDRMRNEIWTTMTGASPLGYVAALRNLHIDTFETKNRFHSINRAVKTASMLAGSKVKLPVYASDRPSMSI